MPVDEHLGDVAEHLGRAVLAFRQMEQLRRFVEKTRRAIAGKKCVVQHQVEQERDVRLDAAHAEFLQATLHAARGIDETQAMRGHLDQQRIVERRDHGARKRRAGVEADAQTARRAIMAQPAMIRHEFVGGILGRHPALDGEAVLGDLRLIAHADLRIRERLPLGDQDLRLDQVVAGDLFGDGVLDLDARIDFDEVELAGIDIEEKFDRAGVVKARGATDGEGGVPEGLARGVIEVRGRGQLDDFLMAALQRAIAFEEMDEIAVTVADELNLDVAGPLDEFLEEDIGYTERRAGLALCLVDRFIELVGGLSDAHAAAAAPHRRLDDDGVAEAFRQLACGGLVVHRIIAARQDRHVCKLGESPRRQLVAELFEHLDARADEDDAGVVTGLSKLRVLGKKAIARMDRIDAAFARQRDDAVDIEIGAQRFAGGADAVGFVGLEAMQGKAVFVGIDRDGADAELVRRTEDANGDLAPIRNHQLADRPDGGSLVLGHVPCVPAMVDVSSPRFFMDSPCQRRLYALRNAPALRFPS